MLCLTGVLLFVVDFRLFDPAADLAFFTEARGGATDFLVVVTFLLVVRPFPVGFLVRLGLAYDLGFALAAMYDPPDV